MYPILENTLISLAQNYIAEAQARVFLLADYDNAVA